MGLVPREKTKTVNKESVEHGAVATRMEFISFFMKQDANLGFRSCRTLQARDTNPLARSQIQKEEKAQWHDVDLTYTIVSH